jgi:hypothetical protein
LRARSTPVVGKGVEELTPSIGDRRVSDAKNASTSDIPDTGIAGSCWSCSLQRRTRIRDGLLSKKDPSWVGVLRSGGREAVGVQVKRNGVVEQPDTRHGGLDKCNVQAVDGLCIHPKDRNDDQTGSSNVILTDSTTNMATKSDPFVCGDRVQRFDLMTAQTAPTPEARKVINAQNKKKTMK